MNEIESSKNNTKESGRVAQLDEHKPSKFEDAGSNPVTVICDICGEMFEKQVQKAIHLRWHHNKSLPSEKLLRARAEFSRINLEKIKCKCPFCGLEREMAKNVFAKHKKYCKQNPNAKPWKSHPQSEETKKKLSEIGLKNNYRRLMRKTQEYHGILYDSSWEVEMAKRLEFLGETFERPKKPISYIGVDGKQHHYFPDFWIPRIQKFIETKNSYLYENDSKVQILKSTRDDIIWITSLDQISCFTL